jgi:hypothetical protein
MHRSYFFTLSVTPGLTNVHCRMQLQDYGSPPEEIMGPLPPGFNMGADGLPNVPENCVIS